MKQPPTRSLESLRRKFHTAADAGNRDGLFTDAAELAMELNPDEPVFCFEAFHPLKQLLRREIPLYLSGAICLEKDTFECRII